MGAIMASRLFLRHFRALDAVNPGRVNSASSFLTAEDQFDSEQPPIQEQTPGDRSGLNGSGLNGSGGPVPNRAPGIVQAKIDNASAAVDRPMSPLTPKSPLTPDQGVLSNPAEGVISNFTNVSDTTDEAVNGDIARSIFGVDGTGIKIGIISDSFNVLGGYNTDFQNGDLPTNVQILKEGPSAGTDEGRAMAEVVHRVAPGAQIYFYSGDFGQVDMANGIQTLKNAGCQIIVDDLTYFTEPFYQDGSVIQSAAHSVVSQALAILRPLATLTASFTNTPGTAFSQICPASGT
jgi:hypothetical protein